MDLLVRLDYIARLLLDLLDEVRALRREVAELRHDLEEPTLDRDTYRDGPGAES